MTPRAGRGTIPVGWDRLESDYREAGDLRVLTLNHGGSWDKEAGSGTIRFPGGCWAEITESHATLWGDSPMPIIEVTSTGSV
jgi:hypothetical protein